MSREFKFRGWDGKTMHYSEQYDCIHFPDWFDNRLSFVDLLYEYNDHTELKELMQYTGLKDKNGKEIYEGDILVTIGNRAEIGISEVVFKNGSYTASYRNEEGLHRTELYLCSSIRKLKVVGNIYENPELLNNVSKK